jgi:hypothetical protein
MAARQERHLAGLSMGLELPTCSVWLASYRALSNMADWLQKGRQIMKLYGYGKDVLTLCAITRNFDDVLAALNDNSPQSDCQTFYRPRFGRLGVHQGPDLGEFEFIILSHQRLYLGESRWHRSPGDIEDGILQIEPELTLRHELFRFYIEHWAFGNYQDWEEFREQAQPHVNKQLPQEGTRLATNLQTVLGVIREHFPKQPTIRDILLYFHKAGIQEPAPHGASSGFELVCIDCSAAMKDNYVKIVM